MDGEILPMGLARVFDTTGAEAMMKVYMPVAYSIGLDTGCVANILACGHVIVYGDGCERVSTVECFLCEHDEPCSRFEELAGDVLLEPVE